MPQNTEYTSVLKQVFFHEDKAWNAWSLLAKPSSSSWASTKQSQLAIIDRRTPLSHLEALPSELIALILSNSSLAKEDIIAMGLCSRLLWLHTFRHIHLASQASEAASWAGKEIACTGSYLLDLPPSFLENDLAPTATNVSTETCRRSRMCLARRINRAAFHEFTRPDDDPEIGWRAAYDAVASNHDHGISEVFLSKLRSDLFSASSRLGFASPLAPHRLRNLTTKEYICCHPGYVSPGKKGLISNPAVPWLRLDDVLLMQICWSHRDHILVNGLPREKSVNMHGEWPGHRFDIVSADYGIGNDNQGHDDQTWKDVTDKVVEQACTLKKKIGSEIAERYRASGHCVDIDSTRTPIEPVIDTN
ncbi:hypothetical protein ACLMJK_009088 [Lecanora helva]